MAEKYLKVGTTGNLEEVEATTTSTGAADAGKIIALNGEGKLDDTMLPAGVGAEVIVAQASEDLAANDVVNLYDNAGTLSVRKASAADATKPAHGYVKEAVTSGGNATVYTDGFLPGSGLTIGSKYFLDATNPGTVTTTPPSGSGNIVQAVGVAIATDKIKFEPDTKFIVRA